MDLLYELETSLFKSKYLKDRDYLNKIFHEDYIEYGKSGMIYRKDDTIKSLLNSSDRDIKIIDFNYKKLDNNIYMVHYVSIHKNNIKALRTSIWIGEDDNLQIYFHQGTLMNK